MLMKDFFLSYLLCFIHPFKVNKYLEEGRENNYLHSEVKDGLYIYPSTKKLLLPRPTLLEFTAIAWIFSMIKAFYGLGAMSFGYFVMKWLALKISIPSVYLFGEAFSYNKFMIFFVLLEMVLFPLGAFVYIKVWELIIRFFINLYEIKLADEEKATSEILSLSLASNLFYIFPIFGELAKHIASLIYIFAGLRSGLGMSVLQSLIVVISPLFIMLFAFLILGIYFALLVAAI